MAKCGQCDQVIPDEAKFCPYCRDQVDMEFVPEELPDQPNKQADVTTNSKPQPGLSEQIPKLELKPLIQLLALLVVVGILLAIIWRK